MKQVTEVETPLNQAHDEIESGSSYPGMAYKEGTKDALEYILGYTKDPPLD